MSEMKLTFIGTGEACDPNRKNVSILVENNNHLHLLDCGFSSSHNYLQQQPDKTLNNIWISHFHGDHFFGIVHLLVHFYQQKRVAPLTILSGTKANEKINTLIEMAYPGLSKKLTFSLNFILLQPGNTLMHDDLTWQSAPTIHSKDSFSLQIKNDHHSVYYSGDGKPTGESETLMKGSHLVIHEAFSLKPSRPAHSSVEECLRYAKCLQIAKLALVHINRETWQQLNAKGVPLSIPQKTELILPNDGDSIII